MWCYSRSSFERVHIDQVDSKRNDFDQFHNFIYVFCNCVLLFFSSIFVFFRLIRMVLLVALGAAAALLVGTVGTYLAMKGGARSHHNGAKVDSTGTINNVIVTDFQDKVEIENKEIVVLLSIMCAIKVIEFMYFLYNKHLRNIKKKCEEKRAKSLPSNV